ncbi:MAG TPA: class I adenylate-forming enzyme family protein [Vicinamibacterales bacterium]|nr:class I adenylate-forming enzyme family protein [Vicinamibacterales bacterium]
MALNRFRCFLAGGLTAANLTDHLFAIYGERVALRSEEPLVVDGSPINRLTYGDLHRLTARCGAVLEAGGVRAGDRVAIAIPNGVPLALWSFATMRVGAVAVPLNALLKPHEIAELTAHSGAVALVVDQEQARNLAPLLAPAVRLVLADGLPAAAPSSPHAVIDPDAPCLVLYTSGTTQFPRGALHTSSGLLGRMHLALLFPGVGRQLVVMALPLSHVMGLVALLLPLIAGVPLYFLASFNAAQVLDRLARERATMFVGVPTMYLQMAAKGLNRFALGSVRAWVSASDAMPVHVIDEFKRCGGLVRFGQWSTESLFVDVYGSVEAGGAVLAGISWPGVTPAAHGLAAWPLPHCRTRIVDDHGAPVAAGIPGELCVRTPSLLRGYCGDRTRPVDDAGWFHTGDLAVRSRFGAVRIVGRLKDVIKCGGYSVYPAEVERVLAEIPGVERSVVFALPHPTKQETPVAAVVATDGASVTRELLIARCRTRLADYKTPRDIFFINDAELPVTVSQKVIRAELVRRYTV